MPLASIGFLVGVLICQSLAELPVQEWCIVIVVLIPLVLRFPNYRLIICIFLGFLYSVFIAHGKLEGQIPVSLEGKDLLITGVISSIPESSSHRSRFNFTANDFSELQDNGSSRPILPVQERQLSRHLKLSWYQSVPDLRVGQRWQLLVRLKRPHGLSNPGGFDYEAWLYQHDISATGYVRDTAATGHWNRQLGDGEGVVMALQRLRENLSNEIKTLMQQDQQAALVTALLVGDRQHVSAEQWRTLTNTGTNHLMAISGLHIGLIAGLVFFLANRIWRLIPRATLLIAAPRVAALCAILAALCYAALAGFTLPTQRALIMVTIAMLAIWMQRPVVPSQILAAALFAVLLYDPTAVINASFWLSFAAVTIIFYTMVGRLPVKSWWWKWGRVQWVIAVGLSPILLFWFQKVPLVSPLANLIAVPLVSFVTVPLTFLAGFLMMLWPFSLSPALAQGTLGLAGWSLDMLWPVLQWLAHMDALQWTASEPPRWTLVPALLGVAYLLAPKGLPARWLGALWLLPLVFYSRQEIPPGGLRLTMLDVGHGLSVVVQTRHHVLLYDTGPRFGDTFDTGAIVVVPYLKQRGIRAIDKLVLSHEDIDHTGGFDAVNRQMPIASVMLTPGMQRDHPHVESCAAGRHWRWDGVDFRVLHPTVDFVSNSDNNRSCVVQIATESDKLLLTGDIERQVETDLVKFFASDDDNLRADIVVVPHHGSRSSSSEQFVRAVNAKYALFSVGYRNRYGLPKADVVERYRAGGAGILATNTSGAIEVLLDRQGIVDVAGYRSQFKHYWSNVRN